MTTGVCKLTFVKGKSVKSHIIPKALTRPEEPGLPLMETSAGVGVKRKWDSWYDQKLVIRKGENYLRDIDTSAIIELRRNQLLWSAFPNGVLENVDRIEGMETHGFRKFSNIDAASVWLFVASIAWRASASEMPEMSFFKLDAEIEEELRNCILTSEVKFDKFPLSLIQLSSIGLKHNQTPTLDGKMVPSLDGSDPIIAPIARIFIEGLICHFHLSQDFGQELIGNALFVGNAENLFVTCIDYNVSEQKDRIQEAIESSSPSAPDRGS